MTEKPTPPWLVPVIVIMFLLAGMIQIGKYLGPVTITHEERAEQIQQRDRDRKQAEIDQFVSEACAEYNCY